MKTYVLAAAILLAVSGCEDYSPKREAGIDLGAVCAKRDEINTRLEHFQELFLSCVNAPRRHITVTDDESDIVANCRIAASHAYGVFDNDDRFMSRTAIYDNDCAALKQIEHKDNPK